MSSQKTNTFFRKLEPCQQDDSEAVMVSAGFPSQSLDLFYDTMFSNVEENKFGPNKIQILTVIIFNNIRCSLNYLISCIKVLFLLYLLCKNLRKYRFFSHVFSDLVFFTEPCYLFQLPLKKSPYPPCGFFLLIGRMFSII